MRLFLLFLLFILIPSIYCYDVKIIEDNNIKISDSQVIIESKGIYNVSKLINSSFNLELKKSRDLVGRFILPDLNSNSYYYNIRIVVSKTFYENFKEKDISLIEHLTKLNVETQRFVSLSKFDRVSNSYEAQRRILIDAYNPTVFNQILYLNLIKTRPNDIDSFKDEENILKYYEITLSPNQTIFLNYYDNFSQLGDVYWIDYSMNLNLKYKREVNFTFELNTDEENSPSPENIFLKDIIIKKEVDPNLIQKGDIVYIKITLQNPNAHEIDSIFVTQEFDSNFEYLNDSSKLILVKPITLLPFENKEIYFELKYVGNENISISPTTIVESLGVVKVLDDEIIYQDISDSSLLKKVIIEKSIQKINSTHSLVILKTQNVGEIDLTNIEISDNYFDFDNTLISKSFLIPKLKVNEEYLIDYEIKSPTFNLPYVTNNDVTFFSTLVVNEEYVIEYPSKINFPLYSTILIGIAGLLLVSDIIFS